MTTHRDSGFFVLRTPLLPFDELEAVSALAEEGDRVSLRSRLEALLGRPEVMEALYLASPSLIERLSLWRRDPLGKKGRGIETALLRYLARMAGRATPFGLFAGIDVGSIGEATSLELRLPQHFRRHSRIDMHQLTALSEHVSRNRQVRGQALYWPNTSLYRLGDRYHYAEARPSDRGRAYHLVAASATAELGLVLDACAGGASVAHLGAALVEGLAGVDRDEAEGYVDQLIDAQILVPDLSPPITGSPADDVLARQFQSLPGAVTAGTSLQRAVEGLRRIDASGLGASPSEYEELRDQVEACGVKADPKRLFQVDLYTSLARSSLGRRVVDEILQGLDLLHQLQPPPSAGALAPFIEAFQRRYEGREVPLWQVLDEDAGIGFLKQGGPAADGSPLVSGLPFARLQDRSASWGVQDALALELLTQAEREGSLEVSLDAKRVRAAAHPQRPPLPDAMAVLATLVAASEAAANAGDFRIVLGGGHGPSGARLLGRFCHGHPDLREYVEQHLRHEESLRPDVIFAEIVYLPEGRLGNVLSRPVLREHELVLLGRSGAARDRQIFLDDLVVSIRRGRIVLRSQRWNKEVVPRLSSAHNFSRRSVGAYRFLSFLQGQGVASNVSWSWGSLDNAPFLPRVTSGRLVLSRARWILTAEEVQQLRKRGGDERREYLGRLREERRMPRWVQLAEGDNALPLDLDSSTWVDVLLDQVQENGAAFLREMYPTPQQLCVRGPAGRFVHEMVIPVVRKQRDEPTALAGPSLPAAREHRFVPGSEWLSARIYLGVAAADQALVQIVMPWIQELRRAGVLDRWFFLRFLDSDPHLRVRLHGEADRLWAAALPQLRDRLDGWLDQGKVWDLQLDTYRREVDRYGGQGAIALAEQIFAADSDAVARIVAEYPGDAGADLRWRLALLSVHRWLEDLEFDLPRRRRMLQSVGAGFMAEFAAGKAMRVQLGHRYRRERPLLEELLSPQPSGTAAWAAGAEILAARSEQWSSAVAQLKARHQAKELTRPLEDIAASCAHMLVNRMLRSQQRAHELVLYPFLERLYASRLARGD